MTGNITILNKSELITEINIEGTIGVTEEWQNQNPQSSIATYQKFKEKIKEINSINSPQIVVNIRSNGGNVNDALLIHDALCELNADITTKCFGYTASAATIIAQAASKGKREMSTNGLYLIHKSTTDAEGNSETLAQTADLLNKTDERIASIYASRSGKPIQNFIALMECNNGNGRWLAPHEAVEAALIDKIIETDQQIKNEEIKNQKLNKMSINQHWDAILNMLGITPRPENRISIEKPDDKQSIGQGDMTNPTVDNSAENEEIKKLQNRIHELEAQTVRSNAAPTKTLSKEDPSVAEVKLSQNALSYYEDVQGFTQNS